MSIRYENKKHDIICHRRNRLQASAHLHSHIEIVYMNVGNTKVWVDDTEYSLSAGDFFLTFPNQVHRYETSSYEDAWLIIFPKEICPEFNSWFKNCVPRSNVLPSAQIKSETIEQIIALLHEYSDKSLSELDAIAAKGLILSLMSYAFSKLEFVEEKMAEALYQAVRNIAPFPITSAQALEVVRQTCRIKKMNPQFDWQE